MPGRSGTATNGTMPPMMPLLSQLIEKFNERFGTEFTESDILPAFNAAMQDPKVRKAAVVNDDVENFGVVFDKAFDNAMMDHVSTIDGLAKRYFANDRDFKSNLDRSARRAAWRMIRDEEGID